MHENKLTGDDNSRVLPCFLVSFTVFFATKEVGRTTATRHQAPFVSACCYVFRCCCYVCVVICYVDHTRSRSLTQVKRTTNTEHTSALSTFTKQQQRDIRDIPTTKQTYHLPSLRPHSHSLLPLTPLHYLSLLHHHTHSTLLYYLLALSLTFSLLPSCFTLLLFCMSACHDCGNANVLQVQKRFSIIMTG